MYEPQSKFQYQDQRVPAQCRDGPIEERSCTDKFCCLLYLVLIIAIVFLSVLCAQHQNLSHSQIQIKLGESQYGKPLLAIQRAILQIILALACVAAVCFILTITTFIFPSLVTYFYMPLMLVLMLLLGGVFLYRFFGQSFPFIAQETQDKYVQKDSLMALVVGIMFIAAFVIALITITCKRQKFRNILPVLRMAKVCFWENCYMFILAIILSVLSILFLYMNIILLQISQNTSHPHIAHFILSGLVILQALWTHGFMQSLSDFLFQAITIFWYFNEKKLGQGYGKCGNNFSASLGLAVRHIGTIIYGSIAAYNPDFVNFWMNTLEKKVPSCYACCCCLHKCICRKISKYSHTMTILQSLDYCSATDQMYSLRRRAKNIIPELYVMGNFFMSLTKILVTMIGVIICYILLLQSNPNLYTKILNIVPPLIVTFLASLEIATHFTNISGLVGDTLSFMYAVDFQIEKSYFGSMEVRSCPWKIKQIIMAVKIGDHADLD